MKSLADMVVSSMYKPKESPQDSPTEEASEMHAMGKAVLSAFESKDPKLVAQALCDFWTVVDKDDEPEEGEVIETLE